MKKQIKFSLTGFIIALLFVAMFVGIFGNFVAEIEEQYGVTGENSSTLNDYQTKKNNILEKTEKIRDSTKIKQDQGALDVIGAYFSSGWSALSTSFSSFGLFESMIEDAQTDSMTVGGDLVWPYIIMLVIIMLVVGVGVSVLVKMRV